MTITEKVSHLKGLIDGLELDQNDKTTKIINEITDILSEMALQMTDFESDLTELNDQVDEIDEDLAEAEDELYGDCCGDCENCGEDCEGEYSEENDDEFLYEVVCPTCGKEIPLTQAMLDEGEIYCPQCDELLEFELQEASEEE